MSDRQHEGSEQDEMSLSSNRKVSRRDFLKVAGIAGASVGVGAGLGGMLAACGGSATTTSSSAVETTATTAVTGSSTTTVSTGAELGAEIKIGLVSPKTGGSAAFGVPDAYCVDRVKEWIADGQVLGDSKKHPITIEVQDSQSDSSRASQVAGTLIGDGCVIVCATSGSDNVNPVADQCEANGVPGLFVDNPWQAYIFGRKGSMTTAFKWTYLYFFGVEDVVADYLGVWAALPTNKKIAAMWSNDGDGQSFSDAKTGFPPVIKGAGLTLINPGLYQPGTEDYTAEISLFKKEGCELLTSVWAPPDFTNFWKQAKQQGWYPTIATVDKAILFPEAIEALGAPPIGVGLISGDWWSPTRPFKSYLTGETCQQWADEYTKRTNNEWTQPLMHVVALEMAIYALQHATDPASKDAIIAAVQTMKFDSIGGPMDFSAPVPANITVGVNHVHPNVYKSPFCAGQWVQGTTFPYDYKVVNNTAAPEIPIDAKQIAVPK